MNTDKIGIIINAIDDFLGNSDIIYYSDINNALLERYGEDCSIEVTKNEFLTAIKEYAGYAEYHLFVGGRKSENPCLVLYGNLHRKLRPSGRRVKHLFSVPVFSSYMRKI